MNRTEKTELIDVMSDVFKSTHMGMLVDFRGLNVAEVTDLRARLHANNTRMRVLKNRIAKIAILGTPFEPLKDNLSDTRAFIYGDDAVAPAKVVTKYLSDNDKLHFVAGLLVTASGGEVLDLGRVRSLGSLPSREELLARLMGMMNAVPAKFVRTLNEIPARFLRTLAAVRDAKGGV